MCAGDTPEIYRDFHWQRRNFPVRPLMGFAPVRRVAWRSTSGGGWVMGARADLWVNL